AAADMTTVPILYLATFLTRVGWLNTTVAILGIVLGLYSMVRGALPGLPIARRIFFGRAAVLVVTPILDIIGGTLVEARLDRFTELPGLLLLVPPFVATAGSRGGILSSRLSSKLQIGLISARGKPEALAALDSGLT